MLDLIDRDILAAFDRSGRRSLSFAEIGKVADSSDVVARLVDRGWLRVGNVPDTYERTEDGRLQLSGPLDVTIYSRPGCHLCQEAKANIAPILAEFGAGLKEINIDEDASLREKYDYEVPVILLGARKVAKYRVDPVQFRKQLRDASR